MISRKFTTFTVVVAAASIAYLSFTLVEAFAQVQPTQTSGGQEIVSAQRKIHIANDTFTLQPGEEKRVTFSTYSNASSQYIVGNATVEGSGIWIKVVDSNGRCPGMEGCIQVALYPKGTPLSYNNDDIQHVNIPIPARMQQLVFYAPSGHIGTITFSFDVVKANVQ
jgi:hypothetical protein